MPRSTGIALRLRLNEHGAVLTTRARGRRAADIIRDVADDPRELILDFGRVEVASAPFLEEILDAAHGIVMRESKSAGRIVLFANMNDDVSATLRLILA